MNRNFSLIKKVMETIEWSSKYEVGNTEIDFQHQIFVKIIRKLIKHKNSDSDKHFIESLFSELLKYAEFHFCSEENIMLEHNYPNYIEHRKEHQKVLAELRNRLFSLQYEYIDFAHLETFIIKWFTTHTLSEDIKLAEYLKANAN